MVHWANPIHNPNGILIGSAVFAQSAHVPNMQIRECAKGRIYAMHAMWPNNNTCLMAYFPGQSG